MERIGWEQKWARTGVKAVIEPQAAADNRRTFSPPTLQTQGSPYELSLIFLQGSFRTITFGTTILK